MCKATGKPCATLHIDGIPIWKCRDCGQQMGEAETYRVYDEYKSQCLTCGSIQAFATAWQRDRAAENHSRRCGK